jgi:NADH dehydrogenase (ubiquinone) Fe-S protein 6
MINDVPPIEVEGRKAHCDGGKGALGHPRVFINLDKIGVPKACGYCGLRFVQKDSHHH